MEHNTSLLQANGAGSSTDFTVDDDDEVFPLKTMDQLDQLEASMEDSAKKAKVVCNNTYEINFVNMVNVHSAFPKNIIVIFLWDNRDSFLY